MAACKIEYRSSESCNFQCRNIYRLTSGDLDFRRGDDDAQALEKSQALRIIGRHASRMVGDVDDFGDGRDETFDLDLDALTEGGR